MPDTQNRRRGNRGKLTFKERDVARLVRAVRAAGLQPTGAEAIIKEGGTTLRVLTAVDQDDNLERELADFKARRHGQD